MIGRSIAAACLVFVFTPLTAWGQATSQLLPVSGAHLSELRGFEDPTLESALSVPAISFIAEADKDAKVAKARIGFQREDLLLDLILAGPVNEVTGEATPADLDGLANQATLEVGLGGVIWSPTVDARHAARVCASFWAAMGIDAPDGWACTRLGLPESGDYRRRFEEAVATGDTLARARVCSDLWNDLNANRLPEQQIRRPDSWECAAASLPGHSYRQSFDGAVHYGTPVLLGVRAKAGRRSLEWADSASLSANSDQRLTWRLTAAVGVFQPELGFLGASFQRERTYSEQAAQDVCRPLGIDDALGCSALRIGAPVEVTTNVVSAEWRRFVSADLAFSVRLAYAPSDERLGVEVPLYFLRGKGGLTGGVRLGWRTDTKQLSMTAFVGEVLQLVGVVQ